MTSSNTITRTVSEVIHSALRKTNDYEDGADPDTEKVEDARMALMEILARWEALPEFYHSTRFRTRTFEDPSVVLESGTYYRCILGFTSYDAATWQASTAYSVGDYVLPSTVNGYVYRCTVAGTSNSSEPTFPAYQGRTVTDSTVTWIAVPDNKPGEGKDWTTYFVEDASETSGSSWAYNTYYHSPGEFELLGDEYDILSAYIRYQKNDYDLEKQSYNIFRTLNQKTEEGMPAYFAMEITDTYDQTCHLRDIPQYTGDEGYILHYEAQIRNLKYDATDDTVELPDVLYSALIWQLCADIADESQIPDATIQRWEMKAHTLVQAALLALAPYSKAGRIDSCY